MAWYCEFARRVLPRPTPTPAGDKPPHYISQSPPLWIPAFAGMDEFADGSPFSSQSLMPASAGTPLSPSGIWLTRAESLGDSRIAPTMGRRWVASQLTRYFGLTVYLILNAQMALWQ